MPIPKDYVVILDTVICKGIRDPVKDHDDSTTFVLKSVKEFHAMGRFVPPQESQSKDNEGSTGVALNSSKWVKHSFCYDFRCRGFFGKRVSNRNVTQHNRISTRVALDSSKLVGYAYLVADRSAVPRRLLPPMLT